jgi:hypothetical protein
MIMKKMFIGFVLLMITGSLAQAQIPGDVTSAVGPSKLVTQLIDAIKPSSFTSDWTSAKDSVTNKAQTASDASGIANTISSVAGFIKPEMFKQGFSAQNIMSLAGNVKSMTDAAGLLKNFEGGLKPEAFLSSWLGQRSKWLSALSLLK